MKLTGQEGQQKHPKNMVEYIFKNGSKLDIMAAQQSSRGKRATGGLMEECILIDQTLLNEVINSYHERRPFFRMDRDKKMKLLIKVKFM